MIISEVSRLARDGGRFNRDGVGARLVVVLSILAVTVPSWAQPSADASPFPVAGNRVAILRFANVTGEPENAWIGAGIAAALEADLCRNGLDVIAPVLVAEAADSFGRSGEALQDVVEILELGRRVGAQWVIVGAYQQLGGQLRLTGRLLAVDGGEQVRSARADGAFDDLFLLQDEIATQLQAPAPVARATPGSLAPTPSSALPPASVDTESARVPGTVSDVPSVSGATTSLVDWDGPPPPVAPEVIARDAEGRTTIRAIRLNQGLQLDGRLDEPVYEEVRPISEFLQQVPVHGAEPSERTEAWVMFDESNLYISGRVYDSAPPNEWVANEMRRDAQQLRENDIFGFALDTFYDRRNGYNFYTNPLGARVDQQFVNESNPNIDWNPVWDVRTGRFEGGWTAEMRVPFKSLRYRPDRDQVWGIQLRRGIRRKNERVYITMVPLSVGPGAIFRVSSAATLTGLEVPDSGRALDIKPYAIGGVSTDLTSDPAVENAGSGDFGVDAKYGLTQSLTADLTYNPDFAQVEVDEQQVNLTRFNLFFPEKREFFLEGAGIFDFARGGFGSFRRGGGGGRGGRGGGDSPVVFFSRRIGLEDGEVVPIIAGGRVTGKAGQFDVGALSIQTDEALEGNIESTNFTVVRVKRDVLRRSSVGGIFTNRSVSLVGDGASQSYGVDGVFSFYENVGLLTYYARTQTPGITDRDSSYQGRFRYNGDRYGVTADHLVIGDNFTPEVGFVRRDNFRKTNLLGRFSPRPASLESVRQLFFEGSIDYFLTADTKLLETRQRALRIDGELENSDRFGVGLIDSYELLEDSFEISPGVELPVGEYAFTNLEATYSFGAQRRMSGTVLVRSGGFWSGDVRAVEYSRGRIEVLDQFSIEPSVSVNWVNLPQGPSLRRWRPPDSTTVSPPGCSSAGWPSTTPAAIR